MTVGYFFCFVGPVAAGKSFLSRRLLERHGEELLLAISATSRDPRPKEVDGEHYFFLTRQQFMERVDSGEFFEWEETHGHLYGTPQQWIRRVTEENRHVLLDVDVRGAMTFFHKFPSQFKGILVLPPSISTLIERVKLRGGVSDEELLRRLETMKRELVDFEKAIDEGGFQFWIVNKDRDKSEQEVEAIFQGQESQKNTDMVQARLELKRLTEEIWEYEL